MNTSCPTGPGPLRLIQNWMLQSIYEEEEGLVPKSRNKLSEDRLLLILWLIFQYSVKNQNAYMTKIDDTAHSLN